MFTVHFKCYKDGKVSFAYACGASKLEARTKMVEFEKDGFQVNELCILEDVGRGKATGTKPWEKIDLKQKDLPYFVGKFRKDGKVSSVGCYAETKEKAEKYYRLLEKKGQGIFEKMM